MKNNSIVRLFTVVLLCVLGVASVKGQGNNFGLGNTEEADMSSLTSRLFNLEERSKFFQVYLNFRGGFDEKMDGDEVGGRIFASHIRPEFLGEIGRWGYRIRLNLSGSHDVDAADGTNNVIDIARIFYKTKNNWSFSFGKSALDYGTFEFDWNPVHVLDYFEFQNYQPDACATSATVGYETHKQLFNFEVANANTLSALSNSPKGQTLYPKTKHLFQYSLSWRGSLLDDRLKTAWSYTLRNEAKNCMTNLVMLGVGYTMGKFEVQVDYNGSFGKLDYLGLATYDAISAGLIDDDEMATGTHYQQWLADLAYRPTKRWNLFAKLGINSSSASSIKQLHHYRQTYEYTVAAQYFLDKEQDMRISLGYFGKNTHFKENIGLNDYGTNRIELSLVCRLKIL